MGYNAVSEEWEMKVSSRAVLPLLALFFASCPAANAHADSYHCLSGDRQHGLRFAWNSYSVNLRHLSFYFEGENQRRPLTAAMKGGTYSVAATEEAVTLRYIQDFVLTKIKLPSGEIVADNTSVADPESFRDIRRYHAVFPGVEEYRFDRGNKTLSLKYKTLFPARKIMEQKFVMQDGAAYPYPELVRVLGPEEGREIFQDEIRQGVRDGLQYSCQEESAFKSILRFWLDLFHNV